MKELSKFVESAREIHKFIQSAIQQYNGLPTGAEGSRCRMILEKLKKLKTSDDDHSSERMLIQIQSLRKEYETMLENSDLSKQEIETEHQRACAQEKRKTKKTKRRTTALLICGTLGATVVGLPYIGAAAAVIARRKVSKACDSRIRKEEERHEGALEAHYSREGIMIVVIKELGNIKFRIGNLVNEIDSLMRSIEDTTNTGEVDIAMKTIKIKMETFLKKIDELYAEADKCIVNL